MLALAALYSSSVRSSFNSATSLCQFSLRSSKASGRPPQPIYLDKVSCSSGVAALPSSSNFFKVLIASTFLRYFSFAPPFPRSLSVIWKFPDFSCSFTSALRTPFSVFRTSLQLMLSSRSVSLPAIAVSTSEFSMLLIADLIFSCISPGNWAMYSVPESSFALISVSRTASGAMSACSEIRIRSLATMPPRRSISFRLAVSLDRYSAFSLAGISSLLISDL